MALPDRDQLAPDAAHSVRVWMAVSLNYGAGRIDAVAEARRRARAVLSERIGLMLDVLDVEVTDVRTDGGDGSQGPG